LLQLTVKRSSLSADLEIAKAFKRLLDKPEMTQTRRRFFLNLLINLFLEKHEPLTYQELETMIEMEEIFDFSNNRLVHDIARHTIAPEIAKEMAKDIARDMAKDIARDMAKDIAKDMAIAIALESKLAEIPALRRFGLTNEQIAEALKLPLEDVQRVQ
ncbi:MAG: hypothetical protein SNJ66_10970, partial [Chloroherpetonaceae bacterium]